MLRTIAPSKELWFEWAPKMEARKGLMLPLDSMTRLLTERDTGYRSVFLFLPDAAAEIKASRSSSGFKQYPVVSQEVFIDLDGGEAQLVRAEAALVGLKYAVWESGGKGFHIVLPTETLTGTEVPEAHRQWVDSLRIDADLSLYRASSLISLPGRIHPKTRRKKTLVKMLDGAQLVVPDAVLVEKPVYPVADIPELSMVLIRLANLTAIEPGPGGRHTALWSVAGSLAACGLSEEVVSELLIGVNATWQNPKPEDEVLRAVRQAFNP
jgi:hypothetical protein